MEISKSDKRKDIKKITDYLRQIRNETKLPILDVPSKKKLVYKEISTLRDAKTAIAKRVDFLLIKKEMSTNKILTEIRSLNSFIPVTTTLPLKTKFL